MDNSCTKAYNFGEDVIDFDPESAIESRYNESDFNEYASYGVVYNSNDDTLFFNDRPVLMLIDTKRSSGFFYIRKTAGENLTVVNVNRDDNGQIKSITDNVWMESDGVFEKYYDQVKITLDHEGNVFSIKYNVAYDENSNALFDLNGDEGLGFSGVLDPEESDAKYEIIDGAKLYTKYYDGEGNEVTVDEYEVIVNRTIIDKEKDEQRLEEATSVSIPKVVEHNEYVKGETVVKELNTIFDFQCVLPLDEKYVEDFESYGAFSINADKGESVYALTNGTVLYVDFDVTYGNFVVIDHGNGNTFLYGHLDEITINSGDNVDAGGIIGFVGDSGMTECDKLILVKIDN